jgi:excisionase family DNA binding protein
MTAVAADATGPAATTAVPERHLYRIPEAMTLLALSRSVIYEQIRAGRLRTVSQGRARRIPASAIREYVALLERESEVSYDQPA